MKNLVLLAPIGPIILTPTERRVLLPGRKPAAPEVAPLNLVTSRVGPRRRAWGQLGIRGVYQTAPGRFQASFTHARKRYNCGVHDTRETAGQAVRAKAAELMGAAAVLNFPS